MRLSIKIYKNRVVIICCMDSRPALKHLIWPIIFTINQIYFYIFLKMFSFSAIFFMLMQKRDSKTRIGQVNLTTKS